MRRYAGVSVRRSRPDTNYSPVMKENMRVRHLKAVKSIDTFKSKAAG